MKCGKNAKPYAPPESYYQFPSIKDEEKFGGCAGDALLTSDETKIKKEESKSKKKKKPENGNLLFESECYSIEEKVNTTTVETNGQPRTSSEIEKIPKKRKLPKKGGTTNIVIPPGSEAYHCVNALMVTQKYWELYDMIVDFVPPTVDWLVETIDWKLLDEKLHKEFATRIYDAYMRLFLSIHDNLGSFWDTYDHVPNLEHQFFHELLDHPTHPMKLQSRYPCYQSLYGLVYGHFNGHQYVFSCYE